MRSKSRARRLADGHWENVAQGGCGRISGRYPRPRAEEGNVIRFIDLGHQISEDDRFFAFYNTVPDEFIGVAGEYTWTSWDDFSEAYEADKGECPYPLERFRGLCHQWVFVTERKK